MLFVLTLLIGVVSYAKECRQPISQPEPIKPIPKINDTNDVRGYYYDVKHYGKEYAEHMKQIGKYAIVRRNIYD